MKKITLIGLFALLLTSTVLLFLFSCLVTLTDGQGALIFIFSIPAMALLLLSALVLGRNITKTQNLGFKLDAIPKVFATFLIVFFVTAFIPVLNKAPQAFLGLLGKTFESMTGKSPYQYARDRKSLPNLLSQRLSDQNTKQIAFSELGVTFAWDKVCIFPPYTDKNKAKAILNLDWNIEERSEIQHSDSINALVFLYQGKVNTVVDLKRSIADFKDANLCLERDQANFQIDSAASGAKVLSSVR